MDNTTRLYEPEAIVDLGEGCQCGIIIDDHCFVILTKNWQDQWQPTSHIPIKVALELSNLINPLCYKTDHISV